MNDQERLGIMFTAFIILAIIIEPTLICALGMGFIILMIMQGIKDISGKK